MPGNIHVNCSCFKGAWGYAPYRPVFGQLSIFNLNVKILNLDSAAENCAVIRPPPTPF